METQVILTLILGIMFFIVGGLFTVSELTYKHLVIFVAMALCGFFMALTVKVENYNRGQIDALKGKQKFEMRIHHEYEHDELMLIDTIFILKVDTMKKSTVKNYVIRPDKEEEYKRDVLVSSIIHRETRNNNVRNEKEDAVGYLQIRQIMIKDVNRIVGYEKYTLEDRWNKEKSIDIFIDFQNHYNPTWDFEVAARIWNGGPKGHKKDSTVAYWVSVEKKYNELLA